VLRSKEWEVFFVCDFVNSENPKKKNILNLEDGHMVGRDM
jgi:hypothetical protein